MPRAARPWFRLYVETPFDPKIRRLHVKHRWLWVVILCGARQSPKPGWLLISEGLEWCVADLADAAGMSTKDVREGLAAMVESGLLESVEGIWRVVNWDERQYEGDFARTTIPDPVRQTVIARDGGVCQDCGSGEDLQIDHKIPATKGGGDDLDNLQLLCGTCNRRKSDRIRQQRYREVTRHADVTSNGRDSHVTNAVTREQSQSKEPEVEDKQPSVELELDVQAESSNPVESVFTAWQESTGHHKAVLDKKRRTAIVKALKHYPVDDLVDACKGVMLFPHNRGETNGTRYDGLDLVLRDSEHIERFRDQARDAIPATLEELAAPRKPCPFDRCSGDGLIQVGTYDDGRPHFEDCACRS